jgi:hypothetical protein
MKKKYRIFVFLLFFLSNFIYAQGLDLIQDSKFIFSPSVGGQFEISTVYLVSEFGALIDIDLLRKESKINISFGTRISYESYEYPISQNGKGPFKDYCFYILHSARNNSFHFNLLSGLSYHTKTQSPSFYPDGILFRAGIELRYNLLNKIVGLVLKGSTSFDKRTTFVGLGVAIGYYK